MASKAIGFHHAGLDLKDRGLVEKLFLTGSIVVLCCTSTLAVGVGHPYVSRTLNDIGQCSCTSCDC